LDDKYAGSSKPKSARVKIFDDDLSDDDEAAEGMTGDNASRGEFDYFGESSGGEESFADEDEDEEDDEDDDVDDFEGEEPEDDESEDGTDGNDEDGLENGSALTQKQARPTITSRSKVDATGTSKAIASHKELDPLASLKSSKAKEVEKGLSIRKQQVRHIWLGEFLMVVNEAVP
jgi:protein AATF/BFR2